jgi:trehalose synthase-fused probable maltokinase
MVDHVVLATAAGDVFLGIVDVRYTLGHPERYVLPVAMDAGGNLHDALELPAFSESLFRLIQHEATLRTANGVLDGSREPRSRQLWENPHLASAIRRVTAEQSNSSVVFDEEIILKIFRKLEPGQSPEIEIGRLLLQRQFPHCPPLLGSLGIEGQAQSTIAVAHRFVPNSVDGWDFACGEFRRHTLPSTVFLEEIRQLGVCVGRLHVCLGQAPGLPGFEPQPILLEDFHRWSSSLIGQLGVVLSECQASVPALGLHRRALLERARRLAHLSPSGMKLRIHGDLHLGQVLKTPSGWQIFDFEGEPGRTHAQRRELHSPLKDVAGMLRSFEYAEAFVETHGAPRGFRALATRKHFLSGYWKALDGSGLLPSSRETTRELLSALELEKGLYELRYELNHRPEWIGIPARFLLRESAG